MVDLESPGRRWPVCLLVMLGFAAAALHAQPFVVPAVWHLNFPSPTQGAALNSTAVAVGDESTMVVVVAAGANPVNPTIQLPGRTAELQMIGHDPVSRLGFVRIGEGFHLVPMKWSNEVGSSATAPLLSMETGGAVKCRGTGWVKQVGGKILPFALLRVNFSRAVPPPGTPLTNDAGQVVGLVFQSSGSGNVGYVIPAEAVHRVRKDVCNGGGRLIRGWLGLALLAESPSPQISRVLPDSPATEGGIKVNDVLLEIGDRSITDYADAANAFFYLVPGQPVRVKLRRGDEHLEFTMAPSAPRG